jgi:hypothetical protein
VEIVDDGRPEPVVEEDEEDNPELSDDEVSSLNPSLKQCILTQC